MSWSLHLLSLWKIASVLSIPLLSCQEACLLLIYPVLLNKGHLGTVLPLLSPCSQTIFSPTEAWAFPYTSSMSWVMLQFIYRENCFLRNIFISLMTHVACNILTHETLLKCFCIVLLVSRVITWESFGTVRARQAFIQSSIQDTKFLFPIIVLAKPVSKQQVKASDELSILPTLCSSPVISTWPP